MNLKEAFRYQNFLDGLLTKTLNYLENTQNIVKTTQKHLKSKANPEARDETIDTTKDRQLDYEVNILIDFCNKIVDWKSGIGEAISSTKRNIGFDIDNAISMNKKKQEVSRVLTRMGSIKPSETIKRGSAYKFNAEGNQVSYNYDVEEVSVIDFDRNKVKTIAKKLVSDADKISTELDRIMVDSNVEWDMPFDINDSYDDILDQYKVIWSKN